ncbi:AfsR family transcriptional regulator [Mycobacterium aquaticum]|uniref:AfsR family transcriptional regulator n=2 Tax=Mycobacterium aquaticum TaxID=1927124 RepID=A0A1X0B910_9MYCO|nr:BTAD domain-containing putative transcriptional regulator [Mycobacterium aquaticum]ORA38832.1 AfsR family transcriptional regulator [Mycobacterium aquaticum]
MVMEFRVLGEVEAYVDGRRLDIGHARQRGVLASLLVDVNRPVSVDQLIDRVWTDRLPHKARNAVAAYISRLRHVLPESAAVRIVRGPAGYTLNTDAQSIDLYRFRQLAAEARAVANPADAVALFTEALGLWRGEPVTPLATPWADDLRNSLDAERFSVRLDRNDAALAAGTHTQLLGDLAATLQEYPLDERVAAQLMLALYRSGRQAEALETYRMIRERLVDELGVDPSPAVQSVHQSILDGDSRPDHGRFAHTALSIARPTGQVPRHPTTLIGRETDVKRAIAALDDGPLITLTGLGGVGKTRLALETAYRAQQDFPDGAWVCELAPLEQGSAVSHAVAATLRLQHIQGAGTDDAVIDYLRRRDLLLVIDNCEHVLVGVARLMDVIVRNCPQVKILATSREALGVEGEQVLSVQPLPEGAAAELFVQRARASRPDFDPDREPVGAVAEICRRLDGVPLAIELAAARTRAMSTIDITRRLDRLRLLSGGSRGAHPRQQSVAATIDWSFQLLDEAEKAFFPRLSVFSGSFDLEAAHMVCADDATEDDTLDLLTRLVDKSMVIVRNTVGPTRYGVLETLRAYGRNRLQECALADEMAARHARYYTELVERATVGMNGAEERIWVERLTPDAAATYTALDFDNVRLAFERAMADRDIDLALRLVTSLLDLMNRTGYRPAGWAYQVIGVADPDHRLFPAAVGVAARAAWVLGDFSQARSLAKLADGRVPGPGTGYLGYPADVLADVDLCTGEAASALAHYEGELANSRASAHPVRLVFILDRLTLCHQSLGTPLGGLAAGQEALRVANATGNPTAQAMAHCALGRALADSAPRQALRYLANAAELAATVENNWLTGMAHMEAAAIVSVHGDPVTAVHMFIEVLGLWERGGPGILAQQWDTLRLIARLLARLGDTTTAAALHRATLAAAAEPPVGSAATDGLGDSEHRPLTGAEAVECARTALQRFS